MGIMKTNLNLPDHTPAPETLAFAHELAGGKQTGDETMSDELAAWPHPIRLDEYGDNDNYPTDEQCKRELARALAEASQYDPSVEAENFASYIPGNSSDANADELAALATAMRDARTDANVLYDLLERAFNVAAVVKPAVNVLTGEVKSLRQQVDVLTSERDAAVLQLKGLEQITDETYNAIWEIAGDGKGEWDYPAQITRYVGYLKDERDTARKWSALWKRMARGYRRMYLFLTTD